MSPIRKKFAANLKKYREKIGMTQEELADRLRISARYVQQLEGRNVPNVKIETLAALAKVLGVEPRDLIS